MKKILFIGGKGYLGSHLKKNLESFKIINPEKKKLNILKFSHLKKYFNKDLDFIINLSGQIGPISNKINILGNKNILDVLKKKKIKPILIFFSTTLVDNYKKNVVDKIKKNQVSKKFIRKSILIH